MSNFDTDAIAVIGGGPAGLMAAERLGRAGQPVILFDAKPSIGRKFLRAGIGGLNLTHAEDMTLFCERFGERSKELRPMLDSFPPAQVRRWAEELGVDTFVGSSGRVFPVGMKAAPLLRAWVQRLRSMGVRFQLRHRWMGWDANGALQFESPNGTVALSPPATILALGGGSWPQLGSDAAWVPILQAKGVDIASLQSANCGFEVNWSPLMRQKYAGAQLKSLALTLTDVHGNTETRRGEFVITEYGIEGGLVYTFSKRLREALQRNGLATFKLDLVPDRTAERVRSDIGQPRGARSMSSHLQSRLGIKGAKVALIREVLSKEAFGDSMHLAAALKALPISVTAVRPLAEAISTAGGIRFEAMNDRLMLNALPGVFAAGEMLDWEAPTGGYLLTACLAQGAWVGNAVNEWMAAKR